jgi:hypothetical protein
MGFFKRLAAANRRVQAAKRRALAAQWRAEDAADREVAKAEAKLVRQVVQGRVPQRLSEGMHYCQVPECGKHAEYLVSGRGAAKVMMCAPHTEIAP